jgi:hypothetical protein
MACMFYSWSSVMESLREVRNSRAKGKVEERKVTSVYEFELFSTAEDIVSSDLTFLIYR